LKVEPDLKVALAFIVRVIDVIAAVLRHRPTAASTPVGAELALDSTVLFVVLLE
jgi:hypothetical protein